MDDLKRMVLRNFSLTFSRFFFEMRLFDLRQSYSVSVLDYIVSCRELYDCPLLARARNELVS